MLAALLWLALHRLVGRLLGPLPRTRIRMGDGIAFLLDRPYAEFRVVWANALRGRELIGPLYRPDGRRVVLNSMQIVYIEPVPNPP